MHNDTLGTRRPAHGRASHRTRWIAVLGVGAVSLLSILAACGGGGGGGAVVAAARTMRRRPPD
jgi:hypothetical protein